MAATTNDGDNPNNVAQDECGPSTEYPLLDAPSEAEKMERFQQILNTSLISLGKQKRKLKLYYNALFAIALISGISATLLTGITTGSKGKVMLGSGPQGWQLTCGVIGLLSLTGTVAGSFQHNVWVKDKFWRVEDSYSLLKSLLTEIELDPSQYLAVRRDYYRLVQRHPDMLS